MPVTRAAIGAILTVAASCAGETPAVLSRVPPFDSLQTISLEMKAGELLATRPGIEVRGYTGYADSLGTYAVIFGFPGSWSDNQAVQSGSKLRSIEARRSFETDSAANSFWLARVAGIQATLGEPNTCRRWTRAGRPGKVASWRHGGTFVTASLFGGTPRYSPATSNDTDGPFVSVFWSTRSPYLFSGYPRNRPTLVPEPCPE